MNKKEKIIKWLKNNGVFEQFYNNFKKHALPIPTNNNEHFIDDAFCFENTREGYNYWNNISDKYKIWYYNEFPNENITIDDFREFIDNHTQR